MREERVFTNIIHVFSHAYITMGSIVSIFCNRKNEVMGVPTNPFLHPNIQITLRLLLLADLWPTATFQQKLQIIERVRTWDEMKIVLVSSGTNSVPV